MFMIEYKHIGWWYWLVTACLLTAGVAGYPVGFLLAIGLTVFQVRTVTVRLLHYGATCLLITLEQGRSRIACPGK